MLTAITNHLLTSLSPDTLMLNSEEAISTHWSASTPLSQTITISLEQHQKYYICKIATLALNVNNI